MRLGVVRSRALGDSADENGILGAVAKQWNTRAKKCQFDRMCWRWFGRRVIIMGFAAVTNGKPSKEAYYRLRRWNHCMKSCPTPTEDQSRKQRSWWAFDCSHEEIESKNVIRDLRSSRVASNLFQFVQTKFAFLLTIIICASVAFLHLPIAIANVVIMYHQNSHLGTATMVLICRIYDPVSCKGDPRGATTSNPVKILSMIYHWNGTPPFSAGDPDI